MLMLLRSCSVSISVVSNFGLDDGFSLSVRGKEHFVYSLHPVWLWDQPSLPSNGYRKSHFPRVKCGQDLTLTTHLCLVPRSRMSRHYTPSPMKQLCGMQQDSFAFAFTCATRNINFPLLHYLLSYCEVGQKQT